MTCPSSGRRFGAKVAGLTSARTAAARAGVSPTSAARAIESLREQGLVSVERQTLPAGRARALDLIRLDYGSPRWQRAVA
jgi:DNA-binding transcriptional MocR family regulator